MAITLSKRAILGLAVAAAGLFVVTLYFLSTADDDQNPIRVKNKQLLIETEDKDAKWHKPGAGEKWRLDVGNRESSEQYTVTAYGANPDAGNPCLKPLEGEEAEIQFQVTNGPLTVFTFNLERVGNKNQPAVSVSGATMSADNSNKVKRLRPNAGPNQLEGSITQLVVRKAGAPVATCSFPADRKVLVELCMHSCS